MNKEKLAIDGGKPVRTKPLPLEFPGELSLWWNCWLPPLWAVSLAELCFCCCAKPPRSNGLGWPI